MNLFADAATRLQTPRDLLRFAVSRFNEAGLSFGHGSANAYDEAAYLILHTLHLPLDTLDPFLDAQLLPAEIAAVIDRLTQRTVQRIPAAYLTREAWLGDFRFYVDERVIVPRSYIAELLRDGLTPWVGDPDAIGHVLDLCTGSACLAILAAHAFPDALVDAADLSPDALAVARRNVQDYALDDRVTLIQSDLFAQLGDRRYDLIVSNPPYVTLAAMRVLPEEYRHEPAMALESGDDGLDHIRVILRDATRHLNPDGLLIVELGHQRDVFERAFPELHPIWPETSHGDQPVFILTREQLAAAV